MKGYDYYTHKTRAALEKLGGWLPVYINGGDKPRCFYCSFAFDKGHDFECDFLWAGDNAVTRGKPDTADYVVLVPAGGLPPSQSMF